MPYAASGILFFAQGENGLRDRAGALGMSLSAAVLGSTSVTSVRDKLLSDIGLSVGLTDELPPTLRMRFLMLGEH